MMTMMQTQHGHIKDDHLPLLMKLEEKLSPIFFQAHLRALNVLAPMYV